MCGQSGWRRGGQQPCHRGNFILQGGVGPAAAVWERGCPASHASHGQDHMPGLPMLFLREQLNLNLALLHVLLQSQDYPPGIPALPRICFGIWGRLIGLNRSFFFRPARGSQSTCQGCPLLFSLCSCPSKKGTESSPDPGGVLGFMFVHMQILLQIVDSLFYY